MAKERLINTRFWNDSWVRKLNALDRYLFIYFLTNEYTNISGIYELPISTVAYGTGIDERDLQQSMLKRLEPKVYYKDGWVIITNFLKYQRMKSDSVAEGVKKSLKEAPKEVLSFAKSVGYGDDGGMMGGSYHILEPELEPKEEVSNETFFPSKKKGLTANRGKTTKSMRKNKIRNCSGENPSDSFESTIDIETGEIAQEKQRKPRNQSAFALQKVFKEKCKETLNITPEMGFKEYARLCNLLKRYSEEDIKEIFEEWFNSGETDARLVSLCACLSDYQLNQRKVKHGKD